MNLIWLTPEFPSSKSNTKGIYIYRTVKELSKYYNVYVICLYPASPPIIEMLKYWKDWKKIYNDWKSNYPKSSDAPADFEDGKIIYLRYYRLPRGKFHHMEGWFAYLQAKKYLKNIIKKPAVIHANWIFPAGTMAKIISKKFNVPFIVSLMGSDVNRLVEGSTFWKSAKNILGRANKVTSVAQDLFEQCKNKNIPLDKSRTELIDNIYEAEKFIIKEKLEVRKILNIGEDTKIIFFAGGLIPLKNVDVLIKATAQLLKENNKIYLYLAGSGIEEGNLKRLVEKENIEDKVTFLGSLEAEDLINYYNAADVFSLQSKSEGLPNVIVESFFCGTPVVATDVGGISTIVKDGINGFLVEPNSVADLKNKLNRALNNSWNRKEIRKSISHLYPENVIKKYHKIYNSLVEEKS